MYFFGDSFDCYALPADALLGYWDSGILNFSLASGRFSGSRAILAGSSGVWLVKSSAVNDAVHHIVCAIQYTGTVSGTNLGIYFQLSDGATNQCCIVFRSDGAILLTSATPGGTVLATYTGAITASNTWYAFEFEVVINNTTGSFAARKNGNTSNDFSATSLNTRPGTNASANKLTVGEQVFVTGQMLDDLLWRSDAASVPWVGDIRCYTRRPVSDALAQWTPNASTAPVTPFVGGSSATSSTTEAWYQAFTPSCNGAVGSVVLNLAAANSGSVKCSLFSDASNAPAAVLGSATTLTGLAAGNNTFTFPTPVPVVSGTKYWVGFITNTVVTGTWNRTSASTSTSYHWTSTTYAAFPTANPTVSAWNALIFTANVTPSDGVNAPLVSEPQQDAAASYVYSATVGQTDQYTLTDTASVPTTVVGVTTRGLFQKSDAGTRNAVVQLKSGGTTVESASTALNTTWGWIARTDLTDPATGAAWTPGGVSTAQVGARVAA